MRRNPWRLIPRWGGKMGIIVTPFKSLMDVADFTTSLLDAGDDEIYRRICHEVDRIVLETVLRHVNGNQVLASELLGISRTTLRAKMCKQGLIVEKQTQED
jgi:DNA-binding NtrC family response regulator